MGKKTLAIEEQNIETFLSEGQNSPFLIPEYQRPYSWDDNEINQLLDDLMEFAEIEESNKSDNNYFLGTIVSYINGENEREIIDGQQRITSLLLLLRAIYTKLSSQNFQTDTVKNLIMEIGPTIWKETDKLLHTVDKSKNFIHSEVIDDRDNKVLQLILETGDTIEQHTV